MARGWLSIRVELVSGRGTDFWPRPGRIFGASRSHTFDQLADAIELAFARWDHAHMHAFSLPDGTQITPLDQWDGDAPDGSIDSATTKLNRLQQGEQFVYLFDFGDDWTHLCTVAAQRIDPLNTLGVIPPQPMPYFGWGDLPDQYDRRWADDDGESSPPKRPARPLADLPPLLPSWGPRQREP
jgi:Plasmid pRiA4b ORF-3-like protein